jgi:SAM-dependent methyltransferase
MFSMEKGGASLQSVCELVKSGSLSPQVAAAQALIAGSSVKEAIALVDAMRPADERAKSTDVVSVLCQHRATCDAMAELYRARGAMPPSGLEEETVEATGRFFDEALRISPHASIAPYSLGNYQLLQRATEEVSQYLFNRRLLGQKRRVLELGCGSGRMQFALTPFVLEAAGADVSAAMIAAAQRRRGGLGGVRFFHAPAHRVTAARDGDYDLVFAVDSFPYIVNAGPVMLAGTFAEMRRVLRHGGDILIFNYSYRGDDNRDLADVSDYAQAFGLRLVSFAAHAFRHWDGNVFHLRASDGC